MVREFKPDDPATVGPRAEDGGPPLVPAAIAYNMIRANFGNKSYSYPEWRAVANDKSFYLRVEHVPDIMKRRRHHPLLQGLDQSVDDPYYHYLIVKNGDINTYLSNMVDSICYQGGKRGRMSGHLKTHLLQFHNGQVVLNEMGTNEDRKKHWRYVLTDKPIALKKTKGGMALVTKVGENGVTLLQYKDGEWFDPRMYL